MSDFLARVVVTPADARIVPEELRDVSDRPMIIRMRTTSRPQQRYDHRLRDLVQRTGDLTIATDLGVPRSTARGWLGAAPTVVVAVSARPTYRSVTDVAYIPREPRRRPDMHLDSDVVVRTKARTTSSARLGYRSLPLRRYATDHVGSCCTPRGPKQASFSRPHQTKIEAKTGSVAR